jgi:hypothetical protein
MSVTSLVDQVAINERDPSHLSKAMLTMSTLERAFELARSGRVLSVPDLRLMLAREGYIVSQIDGPELGRKLRSRIQRTNQALAAA